MIKTFILTSKHISWDSYFWNIVSSFLSAFQSVIFLMVVTRTTGLSDAGIFTLAYADANLFVFIGKYGVRNYQVSDVNQEYSFWDYKMARYISISAMVLAAMVHLFYQWVFQQYSWKKAMAVLLMCCFKVPDALEDVYFGEYQRKGRLDIAAKCMSIRLIASIGSLCIVFLATRDLVFSLTIAVIVSFAVMELFLKWSVCLFDMGDCFSWRFVGMILKKCFPLSVGLFLSQYIGNAPKYAIDMQLNDVMQACYGFLFMPVFVIGLFSSMIYSPVIHRMAGYWAAREMKLFLRQVLLQVLSVTIITALCMMGAYVAGIPVLSVLYSTDLSRYREELCILLLGGGFLALAGLLNVLVTIMRYQNYLLAGYVLVAVTAWLLSSKTVEKGGMLGAAWLYMMLMGALVILFAMIFTHVIVKEYKRKGRHDFYGEMER